MAPKSMLLTVQMMKSIRYIAIIQRQMCVLLLVYYCSTTYTVYVLLYVLLYVPGTQFFYIYPQCT